MEQLITGRGNLRVYQVDIWMAAIQFRHKVHDDMRREKPYLRTFAEWLPFEQTDFATPGHVRRALYAPGCISYGRFGNSSQSGNATWPDVSS